MITCPYCNSELHDDAVSCTLCRSMLMQIDDAEQAAGSEPGSGPGQKSAKARTKPGALRVFTHPWTAFALISLLGVALFFISYRPPEKSPVSGKGQAETENVATGQAEANGEKPEAAVKKEAAKVDQKEDEEQKKLELYNLVVEFEEKVMLLVTEGEELEKQFDKLRYADDKDKRIDEMGELGNKVQNVAQHIRELKAPAGLERAQTSIANSFAIRRRGYKQVILFIQGGNTSQLQSGMKDMNSADEQRKIGLDLLATTKKDLTPAPKAPPAAVNVAPPPPEPEPEKKEAKTPPEAPKENKKGGNLNVVQTQNTGGQGSGDVAGSDQAPVNDNSQPSDVNQDQGQQDQGQQDQGQDNGEQYPQDEGYTEDQYQQDQGYDQGYDQNQPPPNQQQQQNQNPFGH